jgi:hypothetical protein
MKLARTASQVVVRTPAGAPTTLCLLDNMGECASILLGPAECVALAERPPAGSSDQLRSADRSCLRYRHRHSRMPRKPRQGLAGES